MAALPKKRAPRVAPPGAPRLEITGIVMAPDDFGRVRLLIVEDAARPDCSAGRPDCSAGRPDCSAARLRAAGIAVPPADRDGTCGAVSIVAPAARRDHWLAVAASLRGQRARAEVTVRRYMMRAPGRAPAPGVALDLAMLTPVLNPALQAAVNPLL